MEQPLFETIRPFRAGPGSVTVIVPSYNRRVLLGDLLDSLFAQQYPPERYEILVVDNSSGDGSEQAVQERLAQSSCTLRFFRKANEGPAVSRNFGAARAQGEILAFIDSDCLAAPDWLERGVAEIMAGNAMVAGSITPINNLHRSVGFLRHTLAPIERECPLYPTANIFYRRDVFEELGGFDGSFGAFPWGTPVGGEDIDLAWRVRRGGYPYCFAADVRVQHQTSPLSVWRWLLEALRPGVLPVVVGRYPELRREFLFWRIFHDRAQALYNLGLLGTALAPWAGRRTLLLWLPWLIEVHGQARDDLRRPQRWPAALVKIGLLFAYYALQAVALWWASVRYRSAVL